MIIPCGKEQIRGTANAYRNQEGKFHRKTITLETWTSRRSSLSEGLKGGRNVVGSRDQGLAWAASVVRNESAEGSQGQVVHSPGRLWIRSWGHHLGLWIEEVKCSGLYFKNLHLAVPLRHGRPLGGYYFNLDEVWCWPGLRRKTVKMDKKWRVQKTYRSWRLKVGVGGVRSVRKVIILSLVPLSWDDQC